MPVIDASENFLDCVPDDPNKFLVTGDPAVLDQIRKELSKQFHSYLSVYCSDPFFVEVMPAGIDKAHSLLKLLTSIGLTTEQMICCGDGYNDLTMIETAGLAWLWQMLSLRYERRQIILRNRMMRMGYCM